MIWLNFLYAMHVVLDLLNWTLGEFLVAFFTYSDILVFGELLGIIQDTSTSFGMIY